MPSLTVLHSNIIAFCLYCDVCFCLDTDEQLAGKLSNLLGVLERSLQALEERTARARQAAAEQYAAALQRIDQESRAALFELSLESSNKETTRKALKPPLHQPSQQHLQHVYPGASLAAAVQGVQIGLSVSEIEEDLQMIAPRPAKLTESVHYTHIKPNLPIPHPHHQNHQFPPVHLQ